MILLDTHVLLWLLAEPERIGDVARASLSSVDRVLYSALSVAEIEIKRMIGRLSAPADLPGILSSQGLKPLGLTPTHAAAISHFDALVRHDPVDRLLLAQALCERATLLTADQRLLRLGLDWVQDARR